MQAKWFLRGLSSAPEVASGASSYSDGDYASALRHVYGMTMAEWKDKHQTPATVGA